MYARYTVVLKDLMDNEQTRQELSTKLSTYPLYQPKTNVDNIPDRDTINKRLLNEYKYREIGFPTVGRFLDELEIAMCEIMPFYNELFKTIETMANLDNPFDNVDFTESYKETRSGTATTESNETASDEGSTTAESESASTTNRNTENTSKEVNSATPQDSLSIIASDIDSLKYADSAKWNKSNNTDNENTDSTSQQTANTQNTSERAASGSKTSQGSVEHTFTKKGNQGVNTYAHDMNEFRTSIIDVTNQIINDERISSLFMRVF